MKTTDRRISITALLSALLLMATTAPGQETEKPVRMKELPPAVPATVKEQSKDVLMDTSGNVVEIEEQITLASLPPAARAEIVKQAGKGKILMVESITKNNAIVAYEAHVRTAGKISEIKVDPEGKLLPPD